MGNFFAKVKRGLAWIGGIIARFIGWLCDFLSEIGKKVANFLMGHESKIKKADEPKKVGKVIACHKAIKELEKIKEKEEKDISSHDKDLVQECLNDDDEYNDALNKKELEEQFDEIVKNSGY